ncbi:stage V sporulation protein B [Paenibacillus athensensis]|uniref:Stage V sporulation protein B n=1 Tax=Paenibacillus athensensis TaxID=1967502 RepID=A0A4Y8Q394_9BACL|nr:stage V sporulation protein B [Paenibacillus athensensis]MCD1258245.1 stage V sporulation protein B [Paenibacillus athensensis]
MTKQSFIKGTLILMAAGILNRILGFIPRITLPRVIGAEGVGLYQMGWPFLVVMLTIVTGGIPVAIAKLVAEAEAERNEQRVRSILRVSLGLTSSLGLVFTAVCLAGSKWITSHLLTDPRVYYTFVCMSPIILIIGVSSVFRGYFQGRQNMIPTALSQIIETLIRIVMVLVCAKAMLPLGIEFAAAGAMIGVLLGEAGGMLVLLLHFRSGRIPAVRASIGTLPAAASGSSLRRLLRIAMPVTGSKLVGAGSYLLESILIAQSLAAAGLSAAVATSQYGALQGMVIPVLLLPSALTFSLSVSLIPSLSEAAARKDLPTIHKRLHQSLRLALVTGAPFAALMFVLAEPICKFMYNQPDVGVMLKIMAPIALFIYLQAPLQAALQALDKPGAALINTFVGAAVKLTLIVWLASKPELGIRGAIIAINANIVLVTALHWHSVVRLLQFRMQAGDFAKTLLAVAGSGLAAFAVMYGPWAAADWLRFTCACLAGLIVYLLLIAAFKLVLASDLQRIVKLGKKILR